MVAFGRSSCALVWVLVHGGFSSSALIRVRVNRSMAPAATACTSSVSTVTAVAGSWGSRGTHTCRCPVVPLSTGGRGKINSALVFGGPVALQRTVVAATGVPLEGYLITGFDGFPRLIDGIGGLTVNAPVAVKGGPSGVIVRAGVNKLTGDQALAYGRARHGVDGGDFGRSANQGRIIMAAADFAELVGR